MKCWVSAFNAQGSGVIIVVVHVGAVKIYLAALELHCLYGWTTTSATSQNGQRKKHCYPLACNLHNPNCVPQTSIWTSNKCLL